LTVSLQTRASSNKRRPGHGRLYYAAINAWNHGENENMGIYELGVEKFMKFMTWPGGCRTRTRPQSDQ